MTIRYRCDRAALAVALLLFATPALANPAPSGLIWYDDMENGAPGWTSADLGDERVPHFHVSSLNAYDGDLSWYCGDEGLTADGGYGNEWTDHLNLPPIDTEGVPVSEMSWGALKALYLDAAYGTRPDAVRTSCVPILTYAYRHDCEDAYDAALVQVKAGGEWVPLTTPYDGSSGGWQDIGDYGFDLSAYGCPLELRFVFTSDDYCSDEDGAYDSDGGAFSVDNIKVYDFVTGAVYFHDDVEGGGQCAPGVPESGGDYWHVANRPSPAYTDPHCWWCGDDADEARVPPNLMNALATPVIQVPIEMTEPCSLGCLLHCEVPAGCGDWWKEEVSGDAGVTWYETDAWWGDLGMCDGWTSAHYRGISLTAHVGNCAGAELVYRWVVYTDEDGCGPGAAGTAGLFVDDVFVWSGQLWDHPLEDKRALNHSLYEAAPIR